MRRDFFIGPYYLTFAAFLAVSAAACATASSAGSDHKNLTDSVFSIQGVEVKAERIFLPQEAGMKTSAVDTQVLAQKMNLSLSELLSENTPVFIKNHGRGALSTASFRGTAPSHTQVIWNGIPINSPMAGMVDFSLIPVYLIDELNLKHGASSVADRGGGLGGAIHIGNPVDWSAGPSAQFSQGIGSYRTFDEFLRLDLGKTRFKSRTRIYHNYSGNNYPYLNRSVGSVDPESGVLLHPIDTNTNADYLRYGLLQELHYRPGTRHVLSLRYWGQAARRTIPRATSYEGPGHANLNRQADLDHRLAGEWNFFPGKGKLLLRSGYAGKRLDYALHNQVAGVGRLPAVYSESRMHSLVNTLSYSRDLSHGFKLEARLDANWHRVHTADSVSGAGYSGERREGSAFLSLSKTIHDRLNLHTMLRSDWYNGKRALFAPYLGFDLRLIPGSDLLLKGNISRNNHLPTLNDLYWQPGGNPALKPEEGFSVEGGLEYQWLTSSYHLQTELSVYRSDIRNWILWLPSFKGYWEPRNIKRVLSRGLEFSAALRGSAGSLGYRFSGTYALTRSTNLGDPLTWGDASYGKQLPYIPVHSGNLMARLSWRGFYTSWQHNAYGERFTTTSNDPSDRDWLYPYFMNDLLVGKTFGTRVFSMALEFKVYNLFNETYHSVLYRPMPGRNYLMMLKLKI